MNDQKYILLGTRCKIYFRIVSQNFLIYLEPKIYLTLIFINTNMLMINFP